MNLNSGLLNEFTCKYCKKIYEQPVLLPCTETICRPDLTTLYMSSSQDESVKFRSLRCPFCNVVHDEPSTGFPDNRIVQAILKTLVIDAGGAGSSDIAGPICVNPMINYNAGRKSCQRLGEVLAEYNRLRESPFAYIDKYFECLRTIVDASRKEKLQLIEQIYDDFLRDLKKIESECVAHTKTLHDANTRSSTNNYETPSEFSQLPNQLAEWQDELNLNRSDPERCETITASIQKLLAEVNGKLESFKKSLLVNRDIIFKSKAIEKAELANLLGKIKFVDPNNPKKSEKVLPSVVVNGPVANPGLSRNPSINEPSRSEPIANESQQQQQQPVRSTLKPSSESSDPEQQFLSSEPPPTGNVNRRASIDPHGNSGGRQPVRNGPRQQLEFMAPKNLYLVTTDYEAKTQDELSIDRGDLVTINEEDKLNDERWIATVYKRTNVGTAVAAPAAAAAAVAGSQGATTPTTTTTTTPTRATKGLVNPDHVSKMTNQPWYYGNVRRKEAETILRRDCNIVGSFMIRESEMNNEPNHCFSLSVRDQNDVKHYKILNCVENGSTMYYVNHKVKFKMLSELIDFHSKKADGLSMVLTLPCQ